MTSRSEEQVHGLVTCCSTVYSCGNAPEKAKRIDGHVPVSCTVDPPVGGQRLNLAKSLRVYE